MLNGHLDLIFLNLCLKKQHYRPTNGEYSEQETIILNIQFVLGINIKCQFCLTHFSLATIDVFIT